MSVFALLKLVSIALVILLVIPELNTTPGMVSGTVKNTSNVGIGGISTYLLTSGVPPPVGWAGVPTVKTGATGAYSFINVTPGKYDIHVPAQVATNGTSYQANKITVTINAGQTVTGDVTLARLPVSNTYLKPGGRQASGRRSGEAFG